MGKYETICLVVTLLVFTTIPLVIHKIDMDYKIQEKEVAFQANKYHQELQVRKLEAEAAIAKYKALEIESVQALITPEGIVYERK